ncbi:MAG: putative bifunctional diguanylate cyclase/phosphodiesterase [Kangiellaceae bacterium]
MKVNCDSLVTAVWIYDIDNYQILWANPAALELWEASSIEDLKKREFKSTTSDAVNKVLKDYQKSFIENQVFSMFWHFTPNNIEKEAFCHMSGFVLEDGRMALKCEAIQSSLLTENIYSNAILMLSSYDKNGVFISGNPPFIEKSSGEVKHFKDNFVDSKLSQLILESSSEAEAYENDVLLKTKTGDRWFHIQVSQQSDSSGKGSILLQQFDIHKRKLGELSLSKDAETDPLTGLLNRRGLTNRLAKAIDRDRKFSIFYIDLDGFKMINDSMGHAAGDFILQSVASRLTENIQGDGIACRFGGDEFIWVSSKKEGAKQQKVLANKLIEILNSPYLDKDKNPLLVSASIGIANYPDDGEDIDQLFLRADAAMYLAKSQGKRRWVTYIKGMEDSVQRQSLVARHLYTAIENEELQLFYQPIINVETKEVCSFEALLRWHNPVLGNVPADETISTAENIALISDIDCWVIERATHDLKLLRKAVAGNPSVAINISGIHFADKYLPAFLLSCLNKNNLDAKDVAVELTETAIMVDIDKDENSAKRMVEKGIKLSIDDFGTGYSSLEYLHKIPATTVKIDRSFTARVEENDTTISGIKHLLKSLEFNIIVEGVETLEQSRILKDLGLNIQQGYGLGMPEPLSYYLNTQ